MEYLEMEKKMSRMNKYILGEINSRLNIAKNLVET